MNELNKFIENFENELAYVVNDYGYKPKKVYMRRDYYDILNAQHKSNIVGMEDARTICGILIEFKEDLKNMYEFVYE